MFESTVKPVMGRALSNLQDSCTHSDLRDALLLKLVSWEVQTIYRQLVEQ